MLPKEHTLDVSELEPPAPMLEALEATERLKTGEFLHLLHRREPHLLYAHLLERGMQYRAIESRKAAFELLIWRGDDPIAAGACTAEADTSFP